MLGGCSLTYFIADRGSFLKTRSTFDRWHVVFVIVVGVATIAIAIICSSIVDRSYEQVKSIKQTVIGGHDGNENLSGDIVKNAENAREVLSHANDTAFTWRFTDQTISTADFDNLMATHSQLQKLKILRCDFNSESFKHIRKIPLTYLSLSDAAVEKSTIDALMAVPTLKTLEFFRCEVAPTAFENLHRTKVELMRFRKCQLTHSNALSERQLADIAKLKSLVNIDMSKSKFAEHSLQKFSDAQFEVFNISNTNIDDKDLESLSKLRRLQYIDVEGCDNVSCKGLLSLTKIASIKNIRTHLDIGACKFPAPIAKLFVRHQLQIPSAMEFNSLK
jgi:uncharacterized protein YjbI with pentapeptide repeats